MKLQGWACSLQKRRRQQEQEMRVRRFNETLTDAEITRLLNADCLLRARTHLNLLSAGASSPNTDTIYRDVLGHLFIGMLVQNGQRAGALANMKIEVTEAKKEDGKYVITVLEYKTGYKGPAHIAMTESLFEDLRTYISYKRPQSNLPEVFLKEHSHMPFNVSKVNAVLSSRFERVIERPLSVGLFRRSVVSRMWQRNPESRGELARHMSHSEQTAGVYYLAPLAHSRAVAMSTKIAKVNAHLNDNWLEDERYKLWLLHVDQYTAKCVTCRSQIGLSNMREGAIRSHARSSKHRIRLKDRATSDLKMGNLLQVSMDGPNVNWKFHDLLQQQREKTDLCKLINIGSCGLHTIHGAFRRGVEATTWGINSFLTCAYWLFKDTPARREDYSKTGVSTPVMQLKCCQTRWVENVTVIERLKQILPDLKTYGKAVDEGKVPNPGTKSFKVVKNSCMDKLMAAKLSFMMSLVKEVTPFLTRYQADRPMLPFLSSTLQALLRSLMGRIVKDEALAKYKRRIRHSYTTRSP